MSTQSQIQTGRFYTAARKFQQLIGVTPAGEAIPGGPYTITQVIVAVVILAGGFLSRPLWSVDVVADFLIIAAATVGITYIAGRMPRSRRSIINLMNCWAELMLRSRHGKYRGKSMQTSWSKTKPKKPAATKRAARTAQGGVPQTGAASSVEVGAPAEKQVFAARTTLAVKNVHITSGLDRLTADLTTVR